MPSTKGTAAQIIGLLEEAKNLSIRIVIVVSALTGCIVVYVFCLTKAIFSQFQKAAHARHVPMPLTWAPVPREVTVPGGSEILAMIQRPEQQRETAITTVPKAVFKPVPQQPDSHDGEQITPAPIQPAPMRLKKSAVIMRKAAPVSPPAEPEGPQPLAITPEPSEHVELPAQPEMPDPWTIALKPQETADWSTFATPSNMAEAKQFQAAVKKFKPDARPVDQRRRARAFPVAPARPRGSRTSRSTQPVKTAMPENKSTPAPVSVKVPAIKRAADYIPPHKLAVMNKTEKSDTASVASQAPAPTPTPATDVVHGPFSIEEMKALRPSPSKAELPPTISSTIDASSKAPSSSPKAPDVLPTQEADTVKEALATNTTEKQAQIDAPVLDASESAVADSVAKVGAALSPLTVPTSSKLSPAATKFVTHSAVTKENKAPSTPLPTSCSSTSCTVPQTAPVYTPQSSYSPIQAECQAPLLNRLNYQAQAAIARPVQYVQHPAVPSSPNFPQGPVFSSVPLGFSPTPAYPPMPEFDSFHSGYSQEAQRYYTAPPSFEPTPAYASMPEADFYHDDYFEQAQSQYPAAAQPRAASFHQTPQPHHSIPVQRRASSTTASKAIPIVKPPTGVGGVQSHGMLSSFPLDSKRAVGNMAGGGTAGSGRVSDVAVVDSDVENTSISNADTLIEFEETAEQKVQDKAFASDSDADSMIGEVSEAGSQIGDFDGDMSADEDAQEKDNEQLDPAAVEFAPEVFHLRVNLDNQLTETTQKQDGSQPSAYKVKRRARVAARGDLNDSWQERESCRIKLAGAWSLERAIALEQATKDYNNKRKELVGLMNDGELNEDDAWMFPVFSKQDVGPPKVKVPPRQVASAEEDSSDAESADDDDEVSSDVEDVQETNTTAQDAEREEAIDKVRKAQFMCDKAWGYDIGHRPVCGNRYCTANHKTKAHEHKTKAASKLHMATEHYRRSRARLVEVYGGVLPELLEAEFPSVERC